MRFIYSSIDIISVQGMKTFWSNLVTLVYGGHLQCYGFTQARWTALMWAAASGKSDVVTELISLGADVDIQTNVSHFLCLIIYKVVQNHQMWLECTVCYWNYWRAEVNPPNGAIFPFILLCDHTLSNCACVRIICFFLCKNVKTFSTLLPFTLLPHCVSV